MPMHIIIVSGPSGVGKGTLIKNALKQFPSLYLTISATTRPPRNTEVDQESYYFLEEQTFKRYIKEQRFLEWCEVHGFYYGTLKDELEKAKLNQKEVIIEIDTQGAQKLKKVLPDAKMIFIEPPSLQSLCERLEKRQTNTDAEIAKRVETAKKEMMVKQDYDVIITNNNLQDAKDDMHREIKRILQK